MPLADELELLGFDVFGTVVDWRSGVARHVAPFLARRDLAIDPLVFADEWRARYQPSMEPIRRGERPWVRLPVLNRESLVALLAEHGVTDASDAELDHFDRAWERLDPWPDAVEGLTRLKRRYPIVTISNGDIGGMMRLARFGGLPWDAILGAEVARSYKPTRETYWRSAEAAGVAPGGLGIWWRRIAATWRRRDRSASERSSSIAPTRKDPTRAIVPSPATGTSSRATSTRWPTCSAAERRPPYYRHAGPVPAFRVKQRRNPYPWMPGQARHDVGCCRSAHPSVRQSIA